MTCKTGTAKVQLVLCAPCKELLWRYSLLAPLQLTTCKIALPAWITVNITHITTASIRVAGMRGVTRPMAERQLREHNK